MNDFPNRKPIGMYIQAFGLLVSPPDTDLRIYKEEIGRHTTLQMRRANRFVMLSLAGAFRCASGQSISKKAAVYLTTEKGNLGDTESVLDQIFHQHQFPLPYNFINTMSNTASFYVAQTMGLFAPNLTFSSKVFSFERGVELMYSDMQAGRCDEALIGGVDEACSSKEQFETRFQHPFESFAMVEGSNWLLIKNQAQHALGQLHLPENHFDMSHAAARLRRQEWRGAVVVSYGMLVDEQEKEAIAAAVPSAHVEFDFVAQLGYQDSYAACGAAAFLERYGPATWVHINKDQRGQVVILMIDKY